MDDYFQKWLNDNMAPCAIVFSSDQAKASIKKNNLTPSEFLRPFGDFKGLSFSLVFCDIFATVLDSFRLDFFDSESFDKKNDIQISNYILNAISNPALIPEWRIDKNQITKKCFAPVLSNVINYSFPWYQEAEKTFFELTQFNEVEILQQPFLFVYVCSLTDPPEIITDLKDSKTPKLISEGIYEAKMANLIVLLNDKSNKEKYIESNEVESYVNVFQKVYHSYPVIVLDINTQGEAEAEDNPEIKEDIWSRYIHRLDLYNPERIHANANDDADEKSKLIGRGRYISNRERDNNKLKFVTFMTDVLKPNMLNIIKELDDEVTAKRKNKWKSFQKLFQNANKSEDRLGQLNYYQIYKLSPIEKKMYLLSIIQFYFHDYLDAFKNLELLHEDLKNKSKKHQNAIAQIMTICQFMLKENKKKVDLDAPFKAFNSNFEYQSAFKAIIIQIKMMEHLKQYNEIGSLLVQCNLNNIYPFMKPLMIEKASIYHLRKGKFKKFSENMFFAAELFKGDSSEQYKSYAIKCFGSLFDLYNKTGYSFLRLKLYINQEMASLCANKHDFDSTIVFATNCIETLKYYPQSNQIQSDFFKLFLKSLSALKYETIFDDLAIPEIDNSSVFIVEGQDELIYSSLPKEMVPTYNHFSKYTKVYVNPKYIPLTKNDMKAFDFLESILSRKVITNYYLKRHYHINTSDKIYVKLSIYNPFDIAIEIKAFQLIYEVQSEQAKPQQETQQQQIESLTQTTELQKEDIINDSIDVVLEEYATKNIQLAFSLRKSGRVVLKGVEMKLFGVASVIHLFSHQKIHKFSDYHSKRKQYLASLKRKPTDNLTATATAASAKRKESKKKRDFTLDVIEESNDFSISFPSTQEITVYCNELLLMPIVISNNTDLQVTKFTIFLYDSSETEKRNKNVLCNYIHTIDWNLSKEKREVLVPIVPLTVGAVYIKVVIKFEDEFTFKELEARRFIVKLNVLPSIGFEIKEKLLFWNDAHIDFSLKATAHIINRKMLSLTQIDSMHIKPQFKFIQGDTEISNNSPSSKNWNIIDKDSYYKLYSEFKIKKSVSNNQLKHHQSSSSDLHQHHQNQEFSFLSNDMQSKQPQKHIEEALNQLVTDDHLVLHWTSKESNGKLISGLFIHKLALQMPKMDSDSLHSLLSNLVELSVDQEKSEQNPNETFVTLNYSINAKPIEELRNFLNLDLEVDQSIRAFNWIGLKKFTYNPSILRKFLDANGKITISFNFLTQLKGVLDVNKVSFKIYFSDNPDQPVTVLKVPQFRTLEIE